MRLRELRKEDAPLMLEWMKDDFVVHDLAADFTKKTMGDCESFIKDAINQYSTINTCKDIHFAIADDNNEYMGTVSLKNIDRERRRAEFAITVRKSAMGRGYAKFGMDEIIRMGFDDPCFGLTDIYWCVNKKNTRARRFYDKHNYSVIEPKDYMKESYQKLVEDNELIWYLAKKEQ